MPPWLFYALGLAPCIPAVAFWVRRYQEARLRIRTTGLTAALATLVSLSLPLAINKLLRGATPLDADLLVTALSTSVFVGLAVLAWWPILRKGLSKKGILW